MKFLNLILILYKNLNFFRIEEEFWVECFVFIIFFSWKNMFFFVYFMLNLVLFKVIVEVKFFYDFNRVKY